MITSPPSYNDTALMLRYLTLGQLRADGHVTRGEWLDRLMDEVRKEILSRIAIGEHHSP